LTNEYRKAFPDVFYNHKEVVENKILSEWRIGNSIFTSGIINKNNQLKYHLDSGNIKGMMSNMVCFKRKVVGGYLAIPEYDLLLECADNTVVIFDGQKIMHGVTQIKHTADDSYRYTIVYYSLQQMWNCLTMTDELARIRNLKQEREIKRIKAK